MTMRTRITFGLLTLCTLAATATAVEVPNPLPTRDLDARAGQPVDLSPWAYAWRAGRPVQPQPESYFIPRRLDRNDKI
jgi:hypothetical protein